MTFLEEEPLLQEGWRRASWNRVEDFSYRPNPSPSGDGRSTGDADTTDEVIESWVRLRRDTAPIRARR